MGYTKLVSILKEGVGAGTPSLGLSYLPHQCSTYSLSFPQFYAAFLATTILSINSLTLDSHQALYLRFLYLFISRGQINGLNEKKHFWQKDFTVTQLRYCRINFYFELW